jgi:transposase
LFLLTQIKMKRFIQGVDRTQSIVFPERLEDYISEDNPVRIIDAFVDTLDLAALGFKGTLPAPTGRPSWTNQTTPNFM